jgi:TolA-binding protein
MITLEQIRLLESKITRALDLIRVLKEENSTLRKGLESAQRRMRELETLVDGFKTDQKEIESVIVRTLHNLDELEESAAAPGAIPRGHADGAPSVLAAGAAPTAVAAVPSPADAASSGSRSHAGNSSPVMNRQKDAEPPVPKEELDIF